MTATTEESYLVPELTVTDIRASLAFWVGLCGFSVRYSRPEEGFAYLQRGGIRVMLEQLIPGRNWVTGRLEPPLGRGMNLEMTVAESAPILAALRGAGIALYREPEEQWYRAGESETGVHQFLVQDPDGYLLRFSQPLGSRPLA